MLIAARSGQRLPDTIRAVRTQLRTQARQGLGRLMGEKRAVELSARVRDIGHGIGYSTDPEGRRSASTLERLRNVHAGERCFILGNGPSLIQLDLSRLRGEHTFGLNRGYLLFPRIGFETTYHVCINQLVAAQFGRELAALGSRKMFAWRTRQHFSGREDIAFVRTMDRPHFSPDSAKGVWDGSTVTYVALQLAFFFGFEEVILIGVDHNFATKGPANRTVTATSGDASHFDSHYFGPGVRWQLPDLARSEIAYRMANDYFSRAGRRVLDATLEGKLEIFDKADYDDLF